MGNDISRDDNMFDDFNKKSNIVIQQLDNFFGPINGSNTQTKRIKSLDESYRPEFSKEIIDKIKDERQVCNNIIGVYRNTLDGLMRDKNFKQKVNSFIKNKKLDSQKFDINIRLFEPKINEESSICQPILEYYWMKYLIYRMLRNLDPLAEEYALIEKFTQSSKWTNLNKNYQEAVKIKRELDRQRDRVRTLINENINKLLENDLTYNDLIKLYKNLVEDKKLESYIEHIYNVCENISDLERSSSPDSYKFTKRGKIKGVNLQNYKQVKICERLKSSRQTKNITGKAAPVNLLGVSTRGGLPRFTKNLDTTKIMAQRTGQDVKRPPTQLRSILKKSTSNKTKTEDNLDNLSDDIRKLLEDLFTLGGDIDEDYDRDWIRHQKEQSDINNRLAQLQINLINLKRQNISDQSKQQSIYTYRQNFRMIEKEYTKLKNEVQNAKPDTKKSVRFA